MISRLSASRTRSGPVNDRLTRALRGATTHDTRLNPRHRLRYRLRFATLLVVATLLGGGAEVAWGQSRIKDLATLQGVRPNQLVGYGIVAGLDGSGDQTTQTPFTVQSIISMLGQLGVQLPANTSLQLRNVAAVMVTATLPAFARPGQTLDVTVSSMGNSRNLRGGTLLMTPLRGADGQIYSVAQGNILLGGVGASAGGSSVQVNQLNSGRIPNGATVERTPATPVGQGDFVNLELRDADFTTANRMAAAINTSFGEGTAQALDARHVRVTAPVDNHQRVGFLSRMENLAVARAEASPRVIINARTGSVVMNQLVTVLPCAVAHGSLSITISSDTVVSQPNALSAGQTVVGERASIDIRADRGQLVQIPSSTNLGEVVRALNAVGASPQDLLSILQAMRAAGALQAELEII
ncbi:MAG: flagellar basal body P-ring protein FlgI [Proteobacteria bacterium]|nr:flagellar basal body P-ring protein FlgI [Burkholderiales bacterium]